MSISRAIFPLLMGALFFSGCGEQTPTAPPSGSSASISAAVRMTEGSLATLALSKMVLKVSGGGISTIEKEMELSAGGARAAVNVPVDVNLTYAVIAYMDTTEVLSGSTTYTAKSGVDNEIDIALDFLVPALILSPAKVTVNLNDSVTVYLSARKMTDLATFGARVHFDPAALQVIDLGREDEFLSKAGGVVMQAPGGFTKDNVAGTVEIILSIFPSSKSVSGTGTVGRIVFRAVKEGLTELQLITDSSTDGKLGLYDKDAVLLESIALGSDITVQ